MQNFFSSRVSTVASNVVRDVTTPSVCTFSSASLGFSINIVLEISSQSQQVLVCSTECCADCAVVPVNLLTRNGVDGLETLKEI